MAEKSEMNRIKQDKHRRFLKLQEHMEMRRAVAAREAEWRLRLLERRGANPID